MATILHTIFDQMALPRTNMLPYIVLCGIMLHAEIGEAGELGGRGAYELSRNLLDVDPALISKDKSGPHGISFKGDWKLWTLLGEPVKVMKARWKNGDSVTYEDKLYSSKGSIEQCNYVPQRVIDDIRIYDFAITGRVVPLNADHFYIKDAKGNNVSINRTQYLTLGGDAMAKSGGTTEYGEMNFAVPGSPDWDELFTRKDKGREWFVKEGEAKNIVKQGFDLADIRITKMKFDLSGVSNWLSQNKCEKKQKKKKTKSDKVDTRLKNLVASKAKEMTSKKGVKKNQPEKPLSLSAFEQALMDADDKPVKKEVKQTSGMDFESRLAGVEDYRDELERKKQLRLKKEKEERERQERLRREKLISAALEDDLYTVFTGDKDSNGYRMKGFKKNGSVVINAKYHEVTRFNSGVAMVCNIVERYKSRYVKYAFIDHDDNNLSGWKESKALRSCMMSNDNIIRTKRLKYKESVAIYCVGCGGRKSRSDGYKYYYEISHYDIHGELLKTKEVTESTRCGITLCSGRR